MAEPTTPSTLLNLTSIGISPSHNNQAYSTSTTSDGLIYHVLRTPTKGDTPVKKEPLSLSFSPSRITVRSQPGNSPKVYQQLISRPVASQQSPNASQVQYLRVLTNQTNDNRLNGASSHMKPISNPPIRQPPGQRLILPDSMLTSVDHRQPQLTLVDMKREYVTDSISDREVYSHTHYHPSAAVSAGVIQSAPVRQLSTTSALRSHQQQSAAVSHPTSQSALDPCAASATAPPKQKKPCNCTKSQCLKLYCDCFANGEFCSGCNCQNCFNNLDHEEERQRAVKQCLERNPQAFHPKIGKGKKDIRRHQKGCNCKRSGCLKNYCECYELDLYPHEEQHFHPPQIPKYIVSSYSIDTNKGAKIPCGAMCKCVGCKNYEDGSNADRKSLLSLADAAEARKAQQIAVNSKLPSATSYNQMSSYTDNSSVMLPHRYLKKPVIQAVMDCLLTQCREAEEAKCKDNTTEKVILEEFGRCVNDLITASNRQPTL